jgi:hypothetical protein
MGLVVAYVFWRKRGKLPVIAGPGMPPRNSK